MNQKNVLQDEQGDIVNVTGTALDVILQDATTLALDLPFIKAQQFTTLAVATVEDATTITVDNPTGYVDGNVVGLFSGDGSFYFGKQLSIAGSVVTLDTPIDGVFDIGASSLTAIDNMNVDGSATPQIFQIGGGNGGTGGLTIDITRIMGYLQDATTMDDALFGGGNALTKGIVFRYNNTILNNFWNAKTNGELSLLSYDFSYTDKAPSGSYGARFRNTYAGTDKHGVVIRLKPGDTLELIIQDDLTGLEKFNMLAQGHVISSD